MNINENELKLKYKSYKIDWMVNINNKLCDVITLYGSILGIIQYRKKIYAERFKTLKKGSDNIYVYSTQPWFIEIESKCSKIFNKPVKKEFHKSFIKKG